MPRGIPNVKRDETGLRYTTFSVPLVANPKHMSTTYLKLETQTLWARNAKNKSSEEHVASQAQDQRRGTQVLVLHPGSRFFRLGKATDVTPVTVPCVVARKCRGPVPAPARVEGITRPKANADELVDDLFEEKLSAITTSLRERMRFYKLRVTPNATDIASTFNKQFQPEIIAEYNDPYRVDWTENVSTEDAYIGDDALRIADPQRAGYIVRWPICGTNFNLRDYPSLQVALSDIEFLIRKTLKDRLKIDTKDYNNHSIILVIPDFYDRAYVRELVNLLLVTMGFKQICAQQESLGATYGAGISNACVVNLGSTMTNVACVDEGVVIADTRMSLNIGGDDVTEFLYVLLGRIHFPYHDLDLARSYDWNVMEDLKNRLCTLAEGDVALNLYDFVVRRPDRPTEKYGLRAYDEIILAPMCLFEPRVIEFDRKRIARSPFNVTEEIIEHQADCVTNAMVISTQHLMPAALPGELAKQDHESAPSVSQTGTSTSTDQQEAYGIHVDSSAPVANLFTDNVEVIDAEKDDKIPALSQANAPPNAPTGPSLPEYPGGYAIDLCFEASKLPLDVAIFNSARAAGGDDKIRKYLQAVLVIGGTARIPGMAHALESRLQAIATPLVPNMEKVQIIPPPKEVDPSVLVWKGAAVLGKMEGVSELWISKADWNILGMRALKERCFYL